MIRRHLSQRELKQMKKDQADDEVIVVYNPRPQMVTLRLKSKKDFFIDEQSIQLLGKRTAKLSSKRVDWNQLSNLQKRGDVRIMGQTPVATS